jgi:hypothetical protein
MMKFAVVSATGPTGIHLVTKLRRSVASKDDDTVVLVSPGDRRVADAIKKEPND